jgi:hypothetical protein
VARPFFSQVCSSNPRCFPYVYICMDGYLIHVIVADYDPSYQATLPSFSSSCPCCYCKGNWPSRSFITFHMLSNISEISEMNRCRGRALKRLWLLFKVQPGVEGPDQTVDAMVEHTPARGVYLDVRTFWPLKSFGTFFCNSLVFLESSQNASDVQQVG